MLLLFPLTNTSRKNDTSSGRIVCRHVRSRFTLRRSATCHEKRHENYGRTRIQTKNRCAYQKTPRRLHTTHTGSERVFLICHKLERRYKFDPKTHKPRRRPSSRDNVSSNDCSTLVKSSSDPQRVFNTTNTFDRSSSFSAPTAAVRRSRLPAR